MGIETIGKEEGCDASKLFTDVKSATSWNDIAFLRATGGKDISWVAAVTSRYKLIFCTKDESWFFDLEKDPDEQKSVHDNPEYAGVVKTMRAELRALRKQFEVTGGEGAE